MKLLLESQPSLLTCTLGNLYVDDKFECFSLEDVVREQLGVPVGNWKIKANTAIPAGTYPVKMTMSPRFGKVMPLLENVVGFDGVRIHSGNTDRDTEGCILVGNQVSGESVLKSKDAYNALFDKLYNAIQKRGESVSITIRRGK